MEVSAEIKDRIFQAADLLYEAAGRGDAYPTVVEVRKQARANMNDTQAVMKEWRALRKAQSAPIPIQVPDAVQEAGNQAVAVLWQTAQDLATETLRAAQSGWEKERREVETLSQQISEAYDQQSTELGEATQAVESLGAEVEAGRRSVTELTSQLAEVQRALSEATVRADRASDRAAEIERRAEDLKTELDRAHTAVGEAHAELASTKDELTGLKKKADTARESSAAVIDALRNELATVKAHGEANKQALQDYKDSVALEMKRAGKELDGMRQERDQVRSELAAQREQTVAAREDAANQRGQVTTLQAQLKERETAGKDSKQGQRK